MAPRMHDVAIVGYGPTGATLANLLGGLGLSVLVVDKEPALSRLPRAIHCDGEVMRVFHSLGLRAAMDAITRPGQPSVFVDAEGNKLLVRNATGDTGPMGVANSYYYHQPELEAALRDGVARYPNVRVRLGCEVQELVEDDEAVLLKFADGEAACARYVVGCDGARSLVRKTLASGASLDLGLHQPWLVFDALLADDAPALPLHTVQHCNPLRPMTYCNVIGNRRRWEIMLLPGEDPVAMVQPETLWKLVARWITPAHARIERAATYTFHSVIAQGWRRGRLLLAGDAAHQMPPFLGQGLCAGIRDADNLAWKLALVLREQAPAALLDTYESERAPHVREFIELAVRLGHIVQTTDLEEAAERDRMFRAKPDVFEPPSPRLGAGLVLEGTPQAGRVFPQPRLDDGKLLDEHLGRRFAVIATPALLARAQPETRAQWKRLDAAVLPATGALDDCLHSHGVAAVVLRPDRYIVGTATDAAQLDAVTAMLPSPALLAA